MFDLLVLMAYKQCYITVMLNKRRYTCDIAVFDMFTVILPNIFNFFQDHDTTPLVEATVNEMLWYFFHSVIIVLFSNFTLLNFHP